MIVEYLQQADFRYGRVAFLNAFIFEIGISSDKHSVKLIKACLTANLMFFTKYNNQVARLGGSVRCASDW